MCSKNNISRFSCVCVWLSVVFPSFILTIWCVACVYPASPPSSLFVLITSTEACATCPLRAWRRSISTQTEGESKGNALFSPHVPLLKIMNHLCLMTELQHLSCDDWFMLPQIHMWFFYLFKCVLSKWKTTPLSDHQGCYRNRGW